jgi:predicted ATPase
MRLKRLEIRNYKSLRDVVIEPTPLTVLVGPNASGKSNFADALDFLSEVYRSNLEGAVAKKGGYENICYRHASRSVEPIRFRIVFEMQWEPAYLEPASETLIFDHAFELSAESGSLAGLFFVSFEEVSIFRGSKNFKPALALHVFRKLGTIEVEGTSFGMFKPSRIKPRKRGSIETIIRRLSNSELSIPTLALFSDWLQVAPKALRSLRLFQLSPRACRESGVPTPNPELNRFGANLPVLLEYLRTNHHYEYLQLLELVRRVMPSLEAIETDFTHTKALGLFLRETGFTQPWTSEDISDGTIQAIALLAVTFDPRIKVLVIEEPENSVHPWAIRTFVEAFRLASEQKQIILTTHSPILIDQIRPEELWVVRRPGAETLIDPVLSLDPSLKDAWGQGKFTLSEYLDSGALPEAVPAAGL